jgi:PAS domain S-box-containing protein
MDERRFQAVLRRAFLLPLGVAAVLAVTLIFGVQFLTHREKRVAHSDEVITVAARLYRARVDQETGLRAYLLTHDQRFLQPFLEGRGQGRELEDQLRELVADNPAQQARNEKAVEAFEAWSSWADETIAMLKVGRDVSDVRIQERGKELMDQYRQARADFTTAEEGLRDERLAGAQHALRVVQGSIVAICVLIGGFFAILGRRQLTALSGAFGAALGTAEANAAEARRQKEWLHTTLNSIGDAVIATDANGAITFMNPVAEHLTGWSSDEASGAPLADVFRIVNETTRASVENPIDKVRALNRVVGLANHTILISRTGQEFAIDDSGAPIRDADGALAGIVLVFRDVTQQRALESAVRSNERLAVAGRLSASIAHEIHNPLDTVGNLLFLINQQASNQPQIQQLVSTAQREVYRVAQISKNMLSLHRESHAATSVELVELIDGVVALIEETIAKGKRTIRVEHGFSGEVQAFPAELRQVFTNVIKNAVEATKEAGIIRIFSVGIEKDGRKGVLIHVADNGCGVPEEMQSKLFSPFASTKQNSGSGLGLWISRSILEKHGGSIHISSTADSVDAGTTVSIFLPLEVPARTASEDSASATHGKAA